MKRKPLSKLHKEKISRANKGQIPHNKGKKGLLSVESRKKISDKRKLRIGSLAPVWKGGLTPLNMKIRNSVEYKLWRKSVYERDNYTCIWCSQIGGKLNADHIKPFSLFPELRFAIDNGRTLCLDCHKKTDTFGGKAR